MKCKTQMEDLWGPCWMESLWVSTALSSRQVQTFRCSHCFDWYWDIEIMNDNWQTVHFEQLPAGAGIRLLDVSITRQLLWVHHYRRPHFTHSPVIQSWSEITDERSFKCEQTWLSPVIVFLEFGQFLLQLWISLLILPQLVVVIAGNLL